nr:sulfotransferase [Marinigracilibium pacificum]
MTGSEIKPEKWVFIVGCYNSGTTLLTEILSKSNELDVLPDEGVMLTDVLPRPEDFGWRRMWYKCESEMKISNAEINSVLKRMKRHWSHFTNNKKKIIVEKSISNSARMEFFSKNLDNVYFIHLIRDGYAVTEGIQRKAKPMEEVKNEFGSNYDISLAVNQWKRSLEVINNAKSNISNLIEVKYEDLTSSPKTQIDRITSFLGISPIKEENLSGAFEVHGNKKKISNQNEKSYSRLSESDWQLINKLAEKELIQYGYFKLTK